MRHRTYCVHASQRPSVVCRVSEGYTLSFRLAFCLCTSMSGVFSAKSDPFLLAYGDGPIAAQRSVIHNHHSIHSRHHPARPAHISRREDISYTDKAFHPHSTRLCLKGNDQNPTLRSSHDRFPRSPPAKHTHHFSDASALPGCLSSYYQLPDW